MEHQIVDTAVGRIFISRYAAGDKLTKREQERIAVRKSLSAILPEAELEYEESGAPQLIRPGDSYISIAHSSGYLAIYLSDKTPVGVDIQTHTNSLTAGKSYFVNQNEDAAGITASEETLYRIWCVKEAVYKRFSGKISDLKEDVTVHLSESEVTASVNGQIVRVDLREFEHFTLAATLN